VHLLPGNPAVDIVGVNASPHTINEIDNQLGLNKPLIAQYFTWLHNVIQGNLGIGHPSGVPVTTIIGGSYRVDLELIFLSQLIALLVSVPLALYAARKPRSLLDQASTTTTFAFYCLPAFILVIWAVQFLCVKVHLFPGPNSYPFPKGLSPWNTLTTNLYRMILPSLVLAIGSIAVYYRILRGELALTLQEDFVTVARSKGLKTHRILWRHVLRPSSVTLLTTVGNSVALLITGLFIVEIKFGMPGIGYDLVEAIRANDYLTVQGIALFAAVVVVVVNFAIDLITTFVDPRIARA
jgi:peptide/nickel transport system permease protein